MTGKLPDSAARVQAALDELNLDCQVVVMPASTRTAADAAQACGCQVGQIVKSLVFTGKQSGEPVLILASGCNMVDTKKVKAHLGEKISKADAELVRERTGYAIGGVPPLGHRTAMRVLIDQDLLQYQTIWAAAGTPQAVFQLTPQILLQAVPGEVVEVA